MLVGVLVGVGVGVGDGHMNIEIHSEHPLLESST